MPEEQLQTAQVQLGHGGPWGGTAEGWNFCVPNRSNKERTSEYKHTTTHQKYRNHRGQSWSLSTLMSGCDYKNVWRRDPLPVKTFPKRRIMEGLGACQNIFKGQSYTSWSCMYSCPYISDASPIYLSETNHKKECDKVDIWIIHHNHIIHDMCTMVHEYVYIIIHWS